MQVRYQLRHSPVIMRSGAPKSECNSSPQKGVGANPSCTNRVALKRPLPRAAPSQHVPAAMVHVTEHT
jgi:hypothetical protein